MFLSAVSVLVVGQPSSEFPEGLTNYLVYSLISLLHVSVTHLRHPQAALHQDLKLTKTLNITKVIHILLIKHRNVINYVKAQRLSWFGHINRMPETSIVKRIHKWKPFTGRPAGRPESRWEDDVRNGLKEM